MFKKSLLYFAIVSTLIFFGCNIRGKIVDKNGTGLAGITVTLSGTTSMTTTTNANGYYQFGTFANMLSEGDYTITPSGSGCSFSPASQNAMITTQALEDYGDVPWPVGGVDFEVNFTNSTYPNILGRYSGFYTIVVSGCADAGTYDFTLALNITNQTGNKFSGSAIGTPELYPSAQERIKLTGTIKESGEISGKTTHTFLGTGGEGTFSGQLSGNTLSIVNSGHDTFGGACAYTRDMSATRE